jgi:hypothetical protein
MELEDALEANKELEQRVEELEEEKRQYLNDARDSAYTQEGPRQRDEKLLRENKRLRTDQERLQAKIGTLEFNLATAEDMLRTIHVKFARSSSSGETAAQNAEEGTEERDGFIPSKDEGEGDRDDIIDELRGDMAQHVSQTMMQMLEIKDAHILRLQTEVESLLDAYHILEEQNEELLETVEQRREQQLFIESMTLRRAIEREDCALMTGKREIDDETEDQAIMRAALVKHNFSARYHDELSLEKGATIQVRGVGTSEDGWHVAECDGVSGMVPSTHLVFLDQAEAATLVQEMQESEGLQGRKAINVNAQKLPPAKTDEWQEGVNVLTAAQELAPWDASIKVPLMV